MRYLIITEQENNYFYPYINNKNIDIKKVYDIDSPVKKFQMQLLRKLNLDHSKYINSNKTENNYDMIVYFDISCTYRSLPYLKGNNKDVRLFLWNIVDDFIGRLKLENEKADMDYVKSCFDKVYSFDKDDCKKYGLEYYPPLYSSQITLSNRKPEIDVVFLGAEKGRFEKLKEVYCLFEKYEQKYHVYKSGTKIIDKCGLETSNTKITYQEYIDMVNNSKCILDIPQNGQVGFTIRILESIFLKKKLITTFSGIKKYSLYNSNNIYIVGEDNQMSIDDFVSSPYQEISNDILSYYDCVPWLENMKKNIVIPEGI